MRRRTAARFWQFSLISLFLMIAFIPLPLPPSPALAAQKPVCVWNPMSSGTRVHLSSVWGSSATDVFAVGDGGCILHYDGVNWSLMSSGTANPLWGVWGSSSTDVFAVGSFGTVLHYDGNTWRSISVTCEHLKCVWGTSASDVFVAGSEVILHYDGRTWQTMMDLEAPSFLGPCHIWGTSPSDVYVVGRGDVNSIWHFNGSTWQDISSSIAPLQNLPIWGVWGSSASDIFVVGQGDILHFNGSSWGLMSSGLDSDEALIAAWGSAWNDVYAVGWSGPDGLILHYDGTAWTRMSSSGSLNGVWGSSSADVFAVGFYGLILRSAKGVGLQIGAVSPTQAAQGETLEVTITGSHFSGVNDISFGDGFTVNSIAVNSDTEMVVNVTIEPDTYSGYRDLSVATPLALGAMPGAFKVERNAPGGMCGWTAVGIGGVLLGSIAGFVLGRRKSVHPGPSTQESQDASQKMRS